MGEAMEDGNRIFRKVTIGLRGWDNEYVFYVRAYDIADAEGKAWNAFKGHRLNGVCPIEKWYVKKASLYPFDEPNTFFIN